MKRRVEGSKVCKGQHKDTSIQTVSCIPLWTVFNFKAIVKTFNHVRRNISISLMRFISTVFVCLFVCLFLFCFVLFVCLFVFCLLASKHSDV